MDAFVEPSELDVIKDTNLAPNISSQLNGPLVLDAGRLRAIDEQGIDVQVLSHQGGWWYGADRETRPKDRHDSKRKARGLVHRASGSLCRIGLGGVAASDLAAEQLDRVSGVWACVASASPDTSPAKRRHPPGSIPFWAKAEQLGALVFVHPGGADSVIKDNALRGRGDLGNIISNPLETTVFFSRMILTGRWIGFRS